MTRLEDLRAKYAMPLPLDPHPWTCLCGCGQRLSDTPGRSFLANQPFNPRPEYEQSRERYLEELERVRQAIVGTPNRAATYQEPIFPESTTEYPSAQEIMARIVSVNAITPNWRA